MKETAVDNWNVSELDQFFNSRELLAGPIRIDCCTVITDIKLFLQGELATVRAHMGQARYEPYLNRLQLLKTAIS